MNRSSGDNEEILRRLANIEKQVTSLDETSAFAMRAVRDAHIAELDKIFGKGKNRARVYLSANGKRTVGEIAQHLKMQSPNVSNDLSLLEREGLLIPRVEGASTYWAKKALDRTLRISQHLMTRFDLDKEGL